MRRFNAKPPSCEVMVLSESSSDDEENSSSAADVCSETSSVQERRQKKCKNIAPIFLRMKRSCDVERIHKAAFPPRSPSLETGCAGVTLQRGPTQPPPSALHCILQEIQSAHPAFPVRAAFSSLQRRARHRLQCEDVWQQPVGEKRKPMNEMSPRVPKRLRPSLPAAGAEGHGHLSARDVHNSPAPPVKKPRGSKLSRSHRLKARSHISAGLAHSCCEPESGGTNHNQTPKTSGSFEKAFDIEDRLWTEKYSPQNSSDVIGNSAPLTKLHSWLKRWKLRADRDNKRRPEETEEENSDDSWDCGDFQGEAGSEGDPEEPLCSTMLITGPPGVGKTASVYACAQEFGFKVFEVNCSSQRSGRHVLSQLKEATQSHLVETSGKDPLKPAYINFYKTSSSNKSELLPGKTAVPKTATSSSRKTATRSLRCSARKLKTNAATANMTHYFKMKAKVDRCHSGGLLPPEKTGMKTLASSSLDSDQTLPHNKKTATSLILFEEVDVIFDEDVGFLAAIKAFMTTTKRPVVLTTNDPSFRKRFDCSLEEIIYKRPSAASACCYLQLVCLAEKVRVDVEDISCLLRLSGGGDVRRCLLQLQLWVQSRERSQSKYINVSERGSSSDLQLLSGCSAFMLGLQPATLQFLLNHLKCPSWPETEISELLRLLAESWRRGVPLLYTNLELLIDTVTFCGLQKEPSVTHDDVRVKQRNQKISPNVSVQHVKNISKLSRRKKSLTAFDASPFSNPTHKHPRTSLSLNGTCSRVDTERKASKTVTDSLAGLADFFDLMSSLDVWLPAAGSSETFVWTGAELKDSLLDEMSEEDVGSWSQERLLLEIQAAAEGLGCHKCWWRLREVRTEARSYRQQLDDQTWKRLMERLAVKNSSRKNNLSFSVQPLCASSLSQRRYKQSRMVLSTKYFSLQGNREAVSVDYMPLLRFICRIAQRQDEEPARCPNYLSRKDLGISKSTMQLLAEDF